MSLFGVMGSFEKLPISSSKVGSCGFEIEINVVVVLQQISCHIHYRILALSHGSQQCVSSASDDSEMFSHNEHIS